MVSLNNKKGFTIVELLIVIVVIGILATLVIVTFTGIQQKARNSQRQTDVGAVASHLEKFYAETGSYPTLAQLNDSAFLTAEMKGLPADALVDPKGGSTTVGGTASATQYGYTTLPAGCDVVTAGEPTTNCESFVLTAFLEPDSTPYVKKSN